MHLTIQLFWAAARLLVTRFSLACPVDEFSFKEMRTWGQSKFMSYYICVWCESGELAGRKSSKFFCVIPPVESFQERVAKH